MKVFSESKYILNLISLPTCLSKGFTNLPSHCSGKIPFSYVVPSSFFSCSCYLERKKKANLKRVPCKKTDAFSYLKWNYQWIRRELPQGNRIERLKTDSCLCGCSSVGNRGTTKF